MVAGEFFYLDTVPIQAELLTPNKGLTETLDYRRQFNLAINVAQAMQQLAKQGQRLTRKYNPETPVTFRDINRVLESYLTMLLPMTTISSLDQEQLTSHYERRKLLVPDPYLKLNAQYLEELLFTSARTWGTGYGSLGYFLHLRQVRDSYLHPSQLVHQSVLELLEFTKKQGYLQAWTEQFNRLLSEDDAYADVEIYQLQVDLLTKTPEFKATIEELDFYELWLPQVLSWYLQPYRETGSFRQVPQKGTPEVRAMQTLEKVAQACLVNALDDTSFDRLSYQFVHQSIPPVLFSLLDDLRLIRKQTTIGADESTFTEAEQLLKPFVDAISINAPLSFLRNSCQMMLEQVAPPGGYNLILVAIAATLLNRAYCVTHASRTAYSDQAIVPLKSSLPEVLQLLGRVSRLLYLAGYSLQKTNLDHFQIIGSNLIKLSGIASDSSAVVLNLSK